MTERAELEGPNVDQSIIAFLFLVQTLFYFLLTSCHSYLYATLHARIYYFLSLSTIRAFIIREDSPK